MHNRPCYHTELFSYLWQCDEVSQLSSPKNALWYHLNHWPDIYKQTKDKFINGMPEPTSLCLHLLQLL